MGNSEVGHLNLGAGAVVKQDLARIDGAIADGSFFENEVLVGACERARSSPRGRLHLIGLVSDGGVHSGWGHIEACIELAAREGVPDLVLHAFTDGRDTLPHGGSGYLEEVERWLRNAGRIGTVGGRYYGMDRDHRWERTKLAYDAMAHGEGPRADTAAEAIADAYAAGDTDEFIKPTVIGDYDGMRPGDVVIAFNFRPDRMRQIVAALGDPDFDGFERGGDPGLDISTMASYRADWHYPVAFPPRAPETTMAEVISAGGGRQLHVAETEKYAHVTYFFNGGREDEWNGEERRLADSPRDVPTYDHKPGDERRQGRRCVLLGMGGKATSASGSSTSPIPTWSGTPDRSRPRSAPSRRSTGASPGWSPTVHATGGACIVTADHGNAEHMLEPDGSPEHGAYDEPGAADHDGARDRAARGDPRRRLADGARSARDRAARGNDGTHVAGAGAMRHDPARLSFEIVARDGDAQGRGAPDTPTVRSRRRASFRSRPAARSRACCPTRCRESATRSSSATPTT